MSDLKLEVLVFYEKLIAICKKHDLHITPDGFNFSWSAIHDAVNGDWKLCAGEFKNFLSTALQKHISTDNIFLTDPYVREIGLPNDKTLNIAIINDQSLQWYGQENTITAFDFVLEDKKGLFKDCKSFLDLGGHQMIWALYYSISGPLASVKSFEPSLLNALIGLFNLLINGCLQKVEIIPFAVAAEYLEDLSDQGKNMLVDYQAAPIRTCTLKNFADEKFDFVKVDIEGYEFELLTDESFCKITRAAKFTHFELHLGHLISRDISVRMCSDALRLAEFKGYELYSGEDVYEFLKICKDNGFYAFILKQ